MSNLTDNLLAQYKRKIHYDTLSERLLSYLPFKSVYYKVIYRLTDSYSGQIYQIEFVDGNNNDWRFCSTYKIEKGSVLDASMEPRKYVRKTHVLSYDKSWHELQITTTFSESECNSITFLEETSLENALVQIEMDRL